MIYRVVVLPDMQVPYNDEKTLYAIEKYLADNTWDEYINLGDFMDFDCISFYTKGKPRQTEAKRILNDYDVANKILDKHQSIIRKNNKKAKFVYLEGNHEYRVERYLDEYPQLEGIIEVEKGLRLKERKFSWIRSYDKGILYRIGNAYFHHGKYIILHHTKKMVDHYGVSIFYGHTHDVQLYSKVNYGNNKTLVGQSLGCLCKYDQEYIKDNPTNWQQAFGVFYFLPNGFFTYYVPRIFNHTFISPGGKIYNGNK